MCNPSSKNTFDLHHMPGSEKSETYVSCNTSARITFDFHRFGNSGSREFGNSEIREFGNSGIREFPNSGIREFAGRFFPVKASARVLFVFCRAFGPPPPRVSVRPCSLTLAHPRAPPGHVSVRRFVSFVKKRKHKRSIIKTYR